jgi:hypothetical protein
VEVLLEGLAADSKVRTRLAALLGRAIIAAGNWTTP